MCKALTQRRMRQISNDLSVLISPCDAKLDLVAPEMHFFMIFLADLMDRTSTTVNRRVRGFVAPAKTRVQTRVRTALALGALIFGSLSGVSWAAEPVHFPDKRFAACVTSAINKEAVSSAQDLTRLTCNAQGISEVSGIKHLRNLTRLSLFGNRLTSIDLSGLNNLEVLNLANNNLTDINLEPAPALKTLYLFGNQLQHLNLEKQRALVKLKAEKNKLLAVTFANGSPLQKVYLFNNEMVDIKIDSLSALKFLDVRSNPMPDEVYDYLDEFRGVKASHDGNTEDWK